MDDSLLVLQLQNSDNNAYKQLYVKYYSPLCEYASQFVGDADAEELVQDFMLFIWEIREEFVIENSLKSYLFIAVKHRCLNLIKKNKYHQLVHSQIYEKLKDQFDDPDNYIINELAEKIKKAIAELPDTYRDTFVMSRFGDQTNVKIAANLGISVKTVEYRVSQSLKILRVKLKDYLPFITFLFA